MSSTYDLTPVRTPALRGFILRLVVVLLERPRVAALLASLVTRGLGVRDFRVAHVQESPTFLPLHSCEIKDESCDPGETDIPELRRSGPGFRYHRIRDFHELYKNREVSPEEVAERVLQAIAASDRMTPPMRAFIGCDREDVLRQAHEATERYRQGRVLGPLDGVPIAIKDEVDMVPYGTTGGTSFLGKEPAARDSTVVARLRRAGALLLGKTNMHEIGILPDGLNPHYGVARNPYNPLHDTGGSSSGSAAAVAAGLCPAAIGADGGGSIRIPASFCGVVGLKPTFGRVSEYGALPLCWSVAHLGPIAATAEDAALLYVAMAGPDPCDGNTLPQPSITVADASGDLKGVRIGIYPQWSSDAEPEAVAACESLLHELARQGAELVDVAIPELLLLRVAHGLTIHAEMAANMERYDQDHGRDFGLRTRLMLANVRSMRSVDYVRAQQIRTRAIKNFMAALSTADVIATPTTPVTAPVISERDLPQGVADVSQTIEVMRFVNPSNFTGLPAITMPVGYDRSGMPIGMQFVARPWNETILFRLAYAADSLVERTKPATYFDPLPEHGAT